MALFSLLEQHKDGSWWYHPGDTFTTPEEVEECFHQTFDKFHPNRPHKVFEHSDPLPQEFATCTKDFKIFEFLGVIYWPKAKEKQLIKTSHMNIPCCEPSNDAKPEDYQSEIWYQEVYE